MSQEEFDSKWETLYLQGWVDPLYSAQYRGVRKQWLSHGHPFWNLELLHRVARHSLAPRIIRDGSES